MNRVLSLNRYFALTLCVTLLLTLATGMLAWLQALETRSAMLRESRFEFSLSNVKTTMELGLGLGLQLPALPGTQDLIEQNRLQERNILSIDVFDATGHIVFATDHTGVSADIPSAWLAPCLQNTHGDWSTHDDEGSVLCAPLSNGYDHVVGGVVLRYREANRANTFDLLGGYWAPALACLLGLAALGCLGAWWAVRRIERQLERHTLAIMGSAREAGQTRAPAPVTTARGARQAADAVLIGPVQGALAKLAALEHEFAAADREIDRLDNLN